MTQVTSLEERQMDFSSGRYTRTVETADDFFNSFSASSPISGDDLAVKKRLYYIKEGFL